jgi:hypothetical protein
LSLLSHSKPGQAGKSLNNEGTKPVTPSLIISHGSKQLLASRRINLAQEVFIGKVL